MVPCCLFLCRDQTRASSLPSPLSNTVFVCCSTAALFPPLDVPGTEQGRGEGRGEGEGGGDGVALLCRQQAALWGFPLHQVVQREQEGLRLQSSGGLQQGKCQYHHQELDKISVSIILLTPDHVMILDSTSGGGRITGARQPISGQSRG